MQPIHFPVRFGDLSAVVAVEELPEKGAKLGNFFVRALNLNHPGDCAGFRLEMGGVSIAYLPDHEPYQSCTLSHTSPSTFEAVQAELVRFVRECDLLILDTQYDEAEYPRRVGWGHGCVADSVALAIAGEVRELAYFHHDPSHTDTKIAQMVARGRQLVDEVQAPLHIGAARDGDEINLSAAAETSSEARARLAHR
jgi:ribonuclease BN (tRNA processing enzyme)